MSDFVSRQFSGFTAPGAQTSPSAVSSADYGWQSIDKPMKYILRLGDGKVSQGTAVVAPSGGTYDFPLPQKYDSTQFLCISVATDKDVRFSFTSTGSGSCLIHAGANQRGLFSMNGNRIFSARLTNNGTLPATVSFSMFEVPDLDLASSYRIGDQATGIQSDTADATPGWV